MPFIDLRKIGVVMVLVSVGVLAAACGQQPTVSVTLPPTVATANLSTASVAATVPTTAPTEVSPSGDVPDNAVFVTYQNAAGGYSIQYVEGWTVTEQTNNGVAMTDIDSSEVVQIVAAPSGDLMNYITTTDEPQLQTQVQDYQRVDLKTIQVHNQPVVVLSYSATSAPDPVTGKQRAVTSLRYYIPGSNSSMAVLTLTTPPEVDNVDAFKQMLESFTWTA